ncbi:MAG: hypothetical protein ABW154_10040 [Dyella sp.]
MFGWLAPLRIGERARCSTVSSRWLHIAPGALAHHLPALGCTLYLPPREAMTPLGALPYGVVGEQAELTPLLSVSRLRHATVVSRDGPREWIDCINAHGQRQARLYLLPDTDYLAWDALLAQAQPCAGRERHPQVPELHLAPARLTCFMLRHLAGLACLSARAPCRMSALGNGVAQEIARLEATSH